MEFAGWSGVGGVGEFARDLEGCGTALAVIAPVPLDAAMAGAGALMVGSLAVAGVFPVPTRLAISPA